jgi:hypothetical protein
MKNPLLLSSLVAGSAVLGASVAHADPERALASSPRTEPRSYVDVGAMIVAGSVGTPVVLNSVWKAEAGRRIAGDMWIHVAGAYGTTTGTWGSESSESTLEQARVGIEGRACYADRVACLVAGVDVGVQSVTSMDPVSPADDTEVMFAPHVGLELGRTVHVRPSFGVAFGSDYNDVELGLAVGLNL